MDPEELLNEGSALPFLAAQHVGLINSIPTTFGQLNADGMFPAEGLDTPFVRIDIQDGVIRALPVTPGGRPSTIARHGQGTGKIFEIPNISHEDSVLAADIRKWRALASRAREPETMLVDSIERRHARNRLKFDITMEVMKMGALKGQIRDGANTLLYDLYEVFGLDQEVVYLDLNNANFNLPAALEEIIGGTEDRLVNDIMSGVEARISPEMYNKIIQHPSLEKYYANTPAMMQLLNQQRSNVNGQYRRTIEIGGLVLKEYRAKVKMWGAADDASLTRLIEANEGYAYPLGTAESQATYVAPPLDIREEGAAGVDDLIHMTEETMKHGAGLEWKYQANALPLWQKPALLTKLVLGADPG